MVSTLHIATAWVCGILAVLLIGWDVVVVIVMQCPAYVTMARVLQDAATASRGFVALAWFIVGWHLFGWLPKSWREP